VREHQISEPPAVMHESI